MFDIIQLLPDSIANQIAAGEVVQRPASVVKELMENSIDAGSTMVQVLIRDAGKTLIQVIDDGIGMSETDARMSFERHATSKIRKTEDLFSIKTMGFRGEALASIGAVAQVELRTRREADELGIYIVNEGSEIKLQEPVSCQKGTSISVKNLFFNIPARRNFLKANPVEMKHVIDDFQRVALAHHQVSFQLFHNDLEVYNLPAGKLSQRIVNMFGRNYQEQLATCQEETTHVQVHGYVGKPEFARKTRGEQFFFVNNRFIKNNYLHHAVMNAYEGLLPDDSYPFYVLFIDIDPKHIDVNVHPTKTEIKFDDERTVYAVIRSAVKQAIGTHHFTPSIDFDQDVNYGAFTERTFQNTPKTSEKFPFSGFDNDGSRQKTNLENWDKLFDDSFTSNFGNDIPSDSSNKDEVVVTIQSAANEMSTSDADGNHLAQIREKSNPFQLHNTYIVTQVKSGLIFIDQQAAHERILYEKYLHFLEKKSGVSQQFLFPHTLELNPADFSLVMELKDEIEDLGFLFEVFGKNSIVINGAPAETSGNEKVVFEGLIEQFKKNKSELSLSNKENLARAMAKRSSIKAGQKLGNEEMNTLIDQLFACFNSHYTPQGKLTFFIFDLHKIAQFFNK